MGEYFFFGTVLAVRFSAIALVFTNNVFKVFTNNRLWVSVNRLIISPS